MSLGKRQLTKAGLSLLALAVVTLAVGGAVLWDAEFLTKEIIKSALQLIVVVVIGAFLKFLADSYTIEQNAVQTERDREYQSNLTDRERQAQRNLELQELRRTLLDNLLKSYNAVKQIRRALIARGFTSPIEHRAELRDFYDSKMLLLSDAELALESVVKQVKAGAGPLSDAVSDQVQAKMKCMYAYLDKALLDEYKLTMPTIWQLSDGDSWPALPGLQDFLSRRCTSRFYSEFADPFEQVRDAIRSNLLEG